MRVSSLQHAGRQKQAQPADFSQGLLTSASWVCCPELPDDSCNVPRSCQLGRWAALIHHDSHMLVKQVLTLLAQQALTLLPIQHS